MKKKKTTKYRNSYAEIEKSTLALLHTFNVHGMILPVIGGLGFLGGRLFGRHVGATTAITAGIRKVFAFVLDSHVSNEKGKGDAMQLNNEQGRRVHKSFVRNGDGGFQKAIFGGKEER